MNEWLHKGYVEWETDDTLNISVVFSWDIQSAFSRAVYQEEKKMNNRETSVEIDEAEFLLTLKAILELFLICIRHHTQIIRDLIDARDAFDKNTLNSPNSQSSNIALENLIRARNVCREMARTEIDPVERQLLTWSLLVSEYGLDTDNSILDPQERGSQISEIFNTF